MLLLCALLSQGRVVAGAGPAPRTSSLLRMVSWKLLWMIWQAARKLSSRAEWCCPAGAESGVRNTPTSRCR